MVSHLRTAGHDVLYIAEIASSVSDAEIMMRVRAEERVLLTEDKDFGEPVFRRGRSVPGIVLLRIDPAMHRLKATRLDAALTRFGENLLGRFTIVGEARFRSRGLPR